MSISPEENSLVFINQKKEARVAHIVICEQMKITQDAALKLIKKYRTELSEFGRVRFEIVPFKTKGGVQKKKIYALNRDQAMFLITLMKNNSNTVKFKVDLIKSFNEMEGWIKERLQNSLEYKIMSDTLNEVRMLAGKETKHFHYATEAKLVNWAITGEFKPLDREGLNQDELDLLYNLQKRNTVLIGAGMSYQDRKESLKIFAELNNG